MVGFFSFLRTALCSIHIYTYTYTYKYVSTYTYEDTSKNLSEYDVCKCINTRAHKFMLQYLSVHVICLQIFMHEYLRVYTHIWALTNNVRTYMCRNTYVCTNIQIYFSSCVCVYIQIFMCILYIYTPIQ